MQWVQAEKSGDECGSPRCSGHAAQNQKQENCVCCMEYPAHQMMKPGIRSKQLAVEHVGKPRQWMPIAGVIGGESPDYVGPSKPCLDVRVLINVIRVVAANELIRAQRPISPCDAQKQQEANA